MGSGGSVYCCLRGGWDARWSYEQNSGQGIINRQINGHTAPRARRSRLAEMGDVPLVEGEQQPQSFHAID